MVRSRHADDGSIIVRFNPSSIAGIETTEIKAGTYISEAKYDFYEDNRRITISFRPSRESNDYQGLTLEISGSESELHSLFTRALEAAHAVVRKAGNQDKYVDLTLPVPGPVAEATNA